MVNMLEITYSIFFLNKKVNKHSGNLKKSHFICLFLFLEFIYSCILSNFINCVVMTIIDKLTSYLKFFLFRSYLTHNKKYSQIYYYEGTSRALIYIYIYMYVHIIIYYFAIGRFHGNSYILLYSKKQIEA